MEDDADEVVADWTPSPHHEAFDGVLNGGIIGTLLDCHSNWTATRHLMRRRGADRPPTTVTLDYAVRMRRPTPSTVRSISPRACRRVRRRPGHRRGHTRRPVAQVTATCRGTFVAVKPGHPAYDRW